MAEPAAPPAHVVHLRGIRRTFGTVSPTVALDHIDLTVSPGEFVAIMGRSGSGKSTLLNVLGLLETFDGGTYSLAGTDIGTLGTRRIDAIRGTKIGFVFQAFNLIDYLTVTENIAVGLTYGADHDAKEVASRTEELVERMHLAHCRHARPRTLSGGERQRVAIARAVIHRPALLLADEPTGNLDETTSATVMDLFDDFHRDGTTILMVTHEPDIAGRAQRTITIRDGRIDGDSSGAHGGLLAGARHRPGREGQR